MNTNALKGAVGFAGTPALAVGASLLTLALVGAGRGHVEAAASPAPTVTVTQTPAPSGAPTTEPGATASPRATVVAVKREAPPPGVAAAAEPPGGRSGDGGNKPAPQPSPTSQAPPVAASCNGRILAVQMLRSTCVSLGTR